MRAGPSESIRAALPPIGRVSGNAGGFSLMEVVVATVIATVAVVGLAYTFGLGRGFINQYEIGRAAAAQAEGQIELIAATSAGDTLVKIGPPQHMSYFLVAGKICGTQRWMLRWIDDPADGTYPADPNPNDLRQATVTVSFMNGSIPDSVQVTRLLPAQ